MKPYDQYSVNPSQFFEVTTPEVAYILGLLWADGYILKKSTPATDRIQLTNKVEDFEQFLPILKKVGEWNISYRQQKTVGVNRKLQGSATISNRPLVDFLIENDYTSKSTCSADKILSKIPKNLRHFWFRGLFDGDGCIYHNPDGLHIKVSICSAYEQDWNYITQLFSELNDDHYRIERGGHVHSSGKWSKVIITRRKTMLTFLGYIYQGYELDGMGLSRKFEKYKKIIEREIHCSTKKSHRFDGSR